MCSLISAVGGLAAIRIEEVEELCFADVNALFADVSESLQQAECVPQLEHKCLARKKSSALLKLEQIQGAEYGLSDTSSFDDLMFPEWDGTCSLAGSDASDMLEALVVEEKEKEEEEEEGIFVLDRASMFKWKAVSRLENKFKKLVVEEEDLDCDLRCLVASKRAAGPVPELERHIITFDTTLRMLEAGRKDAMKQLAQMMKFISTREDLLLKCEMRWTVQRVALKRKLFLVALIGADANVGANSYAAAMAIIGRMVAPTGQNQSNVSTSVSASVSTNSNVKLSMPRRRQPISEEARQMLWQWCSEHQDKPFPSREEKQEISAKCGITEERLINWMGNYRLRHWPGRNKSVSFHKKQRSNFVSGNL